MLLGALLAVLSVTAAGQSDEEKTHAQLQTLKAEISRINREIGSASKRRDSLQSQLKKAEEAQAQLAQDIAEARRGSTDQQEELRVLRKEMQSLRAARDEQQARIAVELRTAWQMGQQGQIKILLNQESPDTVARVMAYYRYFFQARNELLEEFRNTLLAMDQTQQRIDATIDELAQRERMLKTKQQQLAAAQRERQLAVAQLNESIQGKGARLKQLEADQAELQKLLSAIREAVVNLRVPENYQAFRAAKGKMPWPVPGRASARFGNPRNQGKMRWQGVTIPAEAGTPVKAIHHGRVVYADWLRGMGLLLIIDHGEGYMSLYAHNQSLLREVGEWVTADTPISTVGDSGGQSQPALYFEVREKGKPVNPASWCRR